MSDPESTMIGISSPSGSLRLAKVSAARAPRKEQPAGRAECLLSSITALFVSFPLTKVRNDVLLISLDNFRRVLRLIEGIGECLTKE